MVFLWYTAILESVECGVYREGIWILSKIIFYLQDGCNPMGSIASRGALRGIEASYDWDIPPAWSTTGLVGTCYGAAKIRAAGLTALFWHIVGSSMVQRGMCSMSRFQNILCRGRVSISCVGVLRGHCKGGIAPRIGALGTSMMLNCYNKFIGLGKLTLSCARLGSGIIAAVEEALS